MDKRKYMRNIITAIGFVCLLGVFAFQNESLSMVFLVCSVLCALIPNLLHSQSITLEEIAELIVPRPELQQTGIKQTIPNLQPPTPPEYKAKEEDEAEEVVKSFEEEPKKKSSFLGFNVS